MKTLDPDPDSLEMLDPDSDLRWIWIRNTARTLENPCIQFLTKCSSTYPLLYTSLTDFCARDEGYRVQVIPQYSLIQHDIRRWHFSCLGVTQIVLEAQYLDN
jgi:hypothetical protein